MSDNDNDRETLTHEEMLSRMDNMGIPASIQERVLQLVDYENSIDHPAQTIIAELGPDAQEILTAIVTAGSFIAQTHGHMWGQPFYAGAQPCDVVTALLLLTAINNGKLGELKSDGAANPLGLWLEGIDLSVLDPKADVPVDNEGAEA